MERRAAESGLQLRRAAGQRAESCGVKEWALPPPPPFQSQPRLEPADLLGPFLPLLCQVSSLPCTATLQQGPPLITSGQVPPGTFVGQVEENQLLIAARSAGLPMDFLDRISRVQQPAENSGSHQRFMGRIIELNDRLHRATALMPLNCLFNPSGQTWLLLAFPDGTEADALSIFQSDTGDQQAGVAGVHRIALAGPAYEGVAVLARALLGPAAALDASGALLWETIFWDERGAGVDPRKWSVGCFRNRDQLLPVFLIHISSALCSDLQCTVNRLQRTNLRLTVQRQSQSRSLEKARDALRKRASRAKSKENKCLAGHKRVTVAENPQPKTNLLTMDSNAEEEREQRLIEEANGPGKSRKTRGAGTPGEIALESVVVKLPGPKRKRLNQDGTAPGGLCWDDRVLLNAVLLYLLSHTSLKQAGSAGLSFLNKLALEVYVKAEPRQGCQSRRIDAEKPLPVFKPISPGSVRTGVFALEKAIYEEMIEWVQNSDVLNLGHDGTTVGPWSVQCVHLRAIKRAIRWTDAAGTNKWGADVRSLCLDLKGYGDKFQTAFSVVGEDGKARLTPITAAVNFGSQCHQAGMWHIVTRHHAVTVVGDGGGEAAGKGNRDVARQNMGGENSVGHQVWLVQKAGDDGFHSLNATGLLVPLYEAYGFDPLKGNISTRKPESERVDSIQRMLSEAMRSHRNTAGNLSSSSSSDDDGERIYIADGGASPRDPVEDSSPKPIYDPLFGPLAQSDRAVEAMSFFEFVLWDISSAYPDLCLAATMSDVTEEMVAAVEELVRIVREEALRQPVYPAKCTNITIAGFKTLEKGEHVADDAINLVLGEVTHVHGGRFVCQGGMYTTGPASPLIRANRPNSADSIEGSTEACYVIDPQNAARLENCVIRAEVYASSSTMERKGTRKSVKELRGMVSVLQSRREARAHTKQQTEKNKIVFGPGSKLFAFTHLPRHYVSTEVANLGASTEVGEGGGSSRNAVTIIRADSNSRNPTFMGRMHTALQVALRALGAIGTTQEVDHFGLPLPAQKLPDCAFYTLGRLVSWLTGEFPPAEQWSFNTRLLRCWTDFQAYRQLRHDGALQDVLDTALNRFRQLTIVPDTVTVASNPLAMPSLQRLPAMPALNELWTLAIAALPGADDQRRKFERKELKRKLLDGVLKEASRMAEAAYVPEARDMPRQLCTTGPVMASASLPIGVEGTEDQWRGEYYDVIRDAASRISMHKNPFRHFLMAERDKRGETGGAGQSGSGGEQDETSGKGQPADGGQRSQDWRRQVIKNAFLIWCIRHRAHLAAEAVFKRTDRFPNRAERAVNSARSPYVWPRVYEHMRAYLGLPPPRGKDCVRPGPIHNAVQGAMKAQAETPGPPGGKMTIKKFRIRSRQPATETEGTPRSYHDRVIEEISTTGRPEKPLACAKTRWGTRPKAFRWLSLYSRLLAAALIQTQGQGRELALADTAKDVFNEHGWVEKQLVRSPKPTGRLLHLLLNQTDVLMLSIGCFVEQIMIGPMMNAMSHNLESSSTSVCGIDSFFRKLLHFAKGRLFVGKLNLFDSYTGSSTAADFAKDHGQLLKFKSYSYKGSKLILLEERRKGLVEGVPLPAVVRLAHRGVESLRGAHMRNAFLINPLADVREAMGRFCTESMTECVTTLLCGLRRASLMHINRFGKWNEIVLYPTLEKQWQQEMAPHFPKEMGPEIDAVPVDVAGRKVWELTQGQRFQRNMIKSQWAVAQIIRNDMVEAIEKWFDNELYCILGFIGCSIETRTVKARKTDDPARTIVDVLVANKFAVPNLVIGYRMLDELKSHWPNDYLPDFVPNQLGDLMRSGTAMQQAGEFTLGKNVEGFVLVDKGGRDILDKEGKPMPVGPAPLERCEELAALVHKIMLHIRSNNDVERVFTHATRGFSAGGKNVTPMIISSWVKRRDYISGGCWGKEKDASFLKKFGQWRRFIWMHLDRLDRLSRPDVAGAEEKKMASQLAKLGLKYRRGERFDETHIEPSKDFFTVGQKNDDADDAGDAPAPRKQPSAGARLRKRARAVRAHIEAHKPVPTKKKLATKRPKARGKRKATAPLPSAAAKKARSETAAIPLPPLSAAAASSNSLENDACDDFGGSADPDPASPVAGKLASTDLEGASGLGDAPAEVVSASDGGNLGAVVGETDPGGVGGMEEERASGHRPEKQKGRQAESGLQGGPFAVGGDVPPIRRAGPVGIKQHQSCDQIQEWLDSPAVKDARKLVRDKAKATKKDASSNVTVKGASGVRSDAAATMEDEITNGSNSGDSDEGGEQWVPSKVTFSCSEYIQVTRLTGGEPIRVYRNGESGVALYHVYDSGNGESQLVQVQSVWYDKQKKHWQMKFCRVYSTEMAIPVAELEADKEVVLRADGQVEKVLIQRGRSFLRDLLKISDRLHHIGDVRNTWSPDYIIGIAAKLPASALLSRNEHELKASQDELRRTLANDYGVKTEEARRMAADPIYVGEYFSEARQVEDGPSDSSSDIDLDSDEESNGGAHALVHRPSLEPVRRLRTRVARGKPPLSFVDNLDEDDDEPLFGERKARTSNPKPDSGSEASDGDRPVTFMKRGAASAGGGVGAVHAAAGRGRAEAVGPGQVRGGSGKGGGAEGSAAAGRGMTGKGMQTRGKDVAGGGVQAGGGVGAVNAAAGRGRGGAGAAGLGQGCGDLGNGDAKRDQAAGRRMEGRERGRDRPVEADGGVGTGNASAGRGGAGRGRGPGRDRGRGDGTDVKMEGQEQRARGRRQRHG